MSNKSTKNLHNLDHMKQSLMFASFDACLFNSTEPTVYSNKARKQNVLFHMRYYH
jgi:hypothetical protein